MFIEITCPIPLIIEDDVVGTTEVTCPDVSDIKSGSPSTGEPPTLVELYIPLINTATPLDIPTTVFKHIPNIASDVDKALASAKDHTPALD